METSECAVETCIVNMAVERPTRAIQRVDKVFKHNPAEDEEIGSLARYVRSQNKRYKQQVWRRHKPPKSVTAYNVFNSIETLTASNMTTLLW